MRDASVQLFISSIQGDLFNPPIDTTMPDFTPGQWFEVRSENPEDKMGPYLVLSRYDTEEYRHGRRYNLMDGTGQVIHYCPPENKIFGHLLIGRHVFQVLSDTELSDRLGDAWAGLETHALSKIKDLCHSKLFGRGLDPDHPEEDVEGEELRERYHIQER